jgi:hypothetical protein
VPHVPLGLQDLEQLPHARVAPARRGISARTSAAVARPRRYSTSMICRSRRVRATSTREDTAAGMRDFGANSFAPCEFIRTSIRVKFAGRSGRVGRAVLTTPGSELRITGRAGPVALAPRCSVRPIPAPRVAPARASVGTAAPEGSSPTRPPDHGGYLHTGRVAVAARSGAGRWEA